MATRKRTSRRRTTSRKRVKIGKLTLNLNHKTFITAIFILGSLFIMGASCGSERAIWNNPSQPIEDLAPVIDAHKQAAEDVGKGAKAVGDWGSEFARGWEQADEPKVTRKSQCKPWQLICKGQEN